MSTDIKPEDIEAAIAAAEQRRRLRMGEAAEAKPASSAAAARHQSVLERTRPATQAQPPLPGARELPRGAGTGSAADDELDDSWLDQPAKPKSSGSRFADLPETEVVWEPEPARRGLIVPFAIAAIALLAFGGILWWAYGAADQAGGPVPVITAENDPVKVKPAEEGGLEVPDQDKLVYDQIAEGQTQTQDQGQAEQLLPDAEEPLAPPQPAAGAVPVPLSDPDAETQAALAVEPAAGGSGEEAEAASAAPAAPETTGTGTLTTVPEAQPEPAAPSQPAAAAAPSVPDAPAATAPATSAEEPAEVATLPASTPPATPAPAAPAAGGKWRIQLASVKSEGAAKQEWSRMQQAHPDLLGDMRLTVQRADLGTKGVYFRLQAGPLPNRTTAEDVCAELKSSQQPCIVVKP